MGHLRRVEPGRVQCPHLLVQGFLIRAPERGSAVQAARQLRTILEVASPAKVRGKDATLVELELALPFEAPRPRSNPRLSRL
jgi:hypothetical protein